MTKNIEDLSGERFGRLIVVKFHGKWEEGRSMWDCMCDCGEWKKGVYAHYLKRGAVLSCGCLAKDSTIERSTTHGMSGTRIYSIWDDMKRRCDSSSHAQYHRYGGRGISYYPSWKIFENFHHDMGATYRDTMQIDRIDNDRGYSKLNCRWVTPQENSNNRSNTSFITVGNVIAPLTITAEVHKINQSTLRNRLDRGMSHEDAVRVPIGNNTGLRVQALKDGQVVREFNTMSDGASWCWGMSSAIHACCNWQTATVKWYSWRFSDPALRKEFVPKARGKRVVMLKDGRVANTFETASEAAKHVGATSQTNISKCCRIASWMAHGYAWRFEGDETKQSTERIVMSKDGAVVREFGSPAEAAQFLRLPKSTLIVKCLNGNCANVMGYVFSRK